MHEVEVEVDSLPRVSGLKRQLAEAIVDIALHVGLECLFLQSIAIDAIRILDRINKGAFEAEKGPVDPRFARLGESVSFSDKALAVFEPVADRITLRSAIKLCLCTVLVEGAVIRDGGLSRRVGAVVRGVVHQEHLAC